MISREQKLCAMFKKLGTPNQTSGRKKIFLQVPPNTLIPHHTQWKLRPTIPSCRSFSFQASWPRCPPNKKLLNLSVQPGSCRICTSSQEKAKTNAVNIYKRNERSNMNQLLFCFFSTGDCFQSKAPGDEGARAAVQSGRGNIFGSAC